MYTHICIIIINIIYTSTRISFYLYLIQAQEAYDVLSDPDRRRVYDRVGLTVMKILEVQAFDPQVVKNFQVYSMIYDIRIYMWSVLESMRLWPTYYR